MNFKNIMGSLSAQGRSGWVLAVVLLGFLIEAGAPASAQSLRGTSPTIVVNAALAGADPTPVSSTSSSIRYSGRGYISKITVSTLCISQKFDLTVYASNVPSGHGTAAPAVTLQNGMPAADLITNIPANANNATVTLQYTCAPQFSDGTGTDTHIVTYTQVAQ